MTQSQPLANNNFFTSYIFYFHCIQFINFQLLGGYILLKFKKAISQKIRYLAITLTFAITTVFAQITPAQAYSANAHTWLSGRGCLLVKASKPSVGTILYTANVNSQTPAAIIISTANYPDTYEQYQSGSSYAYAPHFYNPSTGLNYAKTTDTANLRFKNHYTNAITYYNRGNKYNAYRELGMALHYLEDLCNPYHATNSVALAVPTLGLPATNHTEYESWIETNCAYNTTYTETTVTDTTYNFVRTNTVWQIGHQMALDSVTNSSLVIRTKPYIQTTELTKNYAIKSNSDLKRAQRCIAGVIYKFYVDVKAVQ